jgi:YHS domain-containing protein
MLVGLTGEHRDPVCGMSIDTASARRLTLDGRDFYFCSGSCEEEFAADPERFLRAVAILPHVRRARRWFARTGSADRGRRSTGR